MKKVMLFVMTILLFGFIDVYALEGNVTSISVKEKSSTIIVADPTISNNSIDAEIVFKNVGDFVIFTLGLDIDSSEYTIESVTDNNDSDHIKTSYTASGSTIDMKLEYESALTTAMDLNDISITILLKDNAGNTEELVVNPSTGDYIIQYIIMLGLCIIAFIVLGLLLLKTEKTVLSILVFAMIVPFVVLAKDAIHLNVSLDVDDIKVGYDVVFNGGEGATGETQTQLCYFGEDCELPANDFEKTDKAFVGWATEANGEVVYVDEDNVRDLVAGGSTTLYAIWEDYHVNLGAHTWEQIVANAQSEKADRYIVGSTKNITLSIDLNNDNIPENHTYTLRVANNSNPDVCRGDDYSQTACGFVLEFADIIVNYNMNAAMSNEGGWRDSAMRTYVNGTVLNAFPSTVKNAIIPTIVVSGHGSASGETNFTTTDYLYLFSSVEVWGGVYYDTVDTTMTRQLDYYSSEEVTKSAHLDVAIKKNGETDTIWWLRSAGAGTSNIFLDVKETGATNNNYAYYSNGVSPAFRLA